MIKRSLYIVFICLNLLPVLCYSQDLNITGIFNEVSKFGKISLVISNIGSKTESKNLIDILINESIKKHVSVNNVFLINTDCKKNSFLALFLEESKKIFYFDVSGKNSVEVLDFDLLVKHPEEWNRKIIEKVFNEYEYSIISIALLYKNLPYGLKRAVEFHDHVCPGLIIGYYISNFLKNKQKENEKIIVFAIPPFCKDDAIQITLGSTVGKKALFSRNMTNEEKRAFPHLAGIYVFWDENKKRGKGLVLYFNIDEIKKEAGVEERDYPWLWRLKLNDWMLKNQNRVTGKIKIIKEFDVDEKKLEEMKLSNFKNLIP